MQWRETFEDEPSMAQIDAVAGILLRGGVALLPTDTIYGLHAVATDAAAVNRIVALKGRDGSKPFVVLCATAAQLELLGAERSAAAERVTGELWPGPLTAILPLAAPLPASLGRPSLAVRVPDLPWLRGLLERTGPLVSTSANRSGEPPVASPELLAHDLQSAPDAILDGGLREGEPSTIVDFTGDEPRFIREGAAFFSQKVWKTLRNSL